jgi:protein-S-isoprenylcysteine O-methyltransferase Ste14
MTLLYGYLFPAMWLSFLGYWWAMARDVKATERQEPAPSRILRLALMVGAAALLIAPRVPPQVLDERFLPLSDVWFWSGAAVTAVGLLFSAWARRHLGRNWSRAVTVKENHELIRSGPYALVRHPIYTGLLLGFAGSAMALGEWRGLLAVGMEFGALWSKLRLEEKWMRAQFGEPYEVYSRRVAALVPYVI